MSVSVINLADDLLKMVLKTADDAAGSIANVMENPETATALLTAVKSGSDEAVESALKGVEGGSEIVARVTEVMARFGDDFATKMDDLNTAARAGDEAAAVKHFEDAFGSQYLTEGAKTLIQTRVQTTTAGLSDDALSIANGASRETLETGAAASSKVRIQDLPFSVRLQTRLGQIGLATSVGGVGLVAADVHTDNAISQAVLNFGYEAALEAAEQGWETKEELVDMALASTDTLMDYMGWTERACENFAISVYAKQWEGRDPTEEELAGARRASFAAQADDMLNIGAQAIFLSTVIDRKYSDDPNVSEADRDQMVAEAMIDMVAERMSYGAMGEHRVTSDHVKQLASENPEILSSPKIPPRVRSALEGAIPGLELLSEAERSASTSPEAATEVAAPRKAEDNSFFGSVHGIMDDLSQGNGKLSGIFASVAGFMEPIKNFISDLQTTMAPILNFIGALVGVFTQVAGNVIEGISREVDAGVEMAKLAMEGKAGDLVVQGDDPNGIAAESATKAPVLTAGISAG